MALRIPAASIERRTGRRAHAGGGAAWPACSCSQASWAGAVGTTMIRSITRGAVVSSLASGNLMTRR